ncbi:hypothetical protein [Clostridium sp. 'White wine YQ']|uniref:hypothetical protein n=1 Tax=Clostridium sp. 'White wine YQ' TaxID=3027474 RepID=UPI002367174E|nr:hypothetical protein [Clostridium sp. 'White wine YQ']MDD7795040.1 hypothetical protein [Clostridium sp. 'White wine YQ']
MRDILDIRVAEGKPYFKNNSVTKILDGFKIKRIEQINLNEFHSNIVRVSIPPNLDWDSYSNNVVRAIGKRRWDSVSVKGNRKYDFNYLGNFQRDVLSYGIIASIKIILMNNHKKISSATIGIEDGGNISNLPIIKQCALYTNKILLITKKYKEASKIREYIIANYGVSPEIVFTEDKAENIDFIVSEYDKEYNSLGVWYLNNYYFPKNDIMHAINDVEFYFPELKEDIPPELLGALLKSSKRNNKTVEEILSFNKIEISKIKLGKKEIKV